MLLTIVENAFGFNQAAGGVLGVTVIQGIKRGLFSNEAGEGSAPNAAAVATVSHPVKQGLIQALGVFTDTLVVCSCTAFLDPRNRKYRQSLRGCDDMALCIQQHHRQLLLLLW